MILKSLIILSIVANLLGLNAVSDKLDQAVIGQRAGVKKVANASIQSLTLPEILPRPSLRTGAPQAYANARHFLLADLETGLILAKHESAAKVPIASTTKIMTAIVVLESYDLENEVTVSETAANQIGADSYLRTGEVITVENLLNCMLIKSGNDAAYALAEHMNSQGEYGVSKFVAKMNEKAKELKLENTFFKDPAGLSAEGYSSAFDLFIMTKYALNKPEFASIVKKKEWTAKSADGATWHELKSSNRLVTEYDYPGAIGVKTGYTPEAGHCLVGAAEKDGRILVSIVLNTYSDTPSASADEAKKLFDWGFQYIAWE